MFQTLLDTGNRAAVLKRVRRLTPDSPALWGTMNVGGMLNHLSDSFDICTGARPSRDYSSFKTRTLYRVVALSLPMRFPKGVPTAAEVDQNRDGSPPASFEADRDRLIDTATRFARDLDADLWVHPLFGPLTRGEWGRWGWRHLDHHLRQFGV